MGKFHQWSLDLKQLLFPVDRCLVCGKIGAGALCEDCWEELKAARRCPRCGVFLAEETGYCPYCNLLTEHSFDLVLAAAPYDGELRRQLLAYKYRQQTWLTRPLTDLLEVALQDYPLADCLLTSVPLAAEKLRQRGYNQAELLARELAKRYDLVYLDQALVRQKNTPALHNLKPHQRLKVMEDAFIPGADSVNGQTIILVDDIYTTGATTGTCAKILKQAGAKRVIVLAVAAARV